MRITQPVLLQSFSDEFAAGKKGGAVGSPGAPGETLHKCDEGAEVDAQRQREYRSGVGKLLYMKKWSNLHLGMLAQIFKLFARKLPQLQLKESLMVKTRKIKKTMMISMI